jgi:hypothetical protein
MRSSRAVNVCANAYDEKGIASGAPNPLAHCDVKVPGHLPSSCEMLSQVTWCDKGRCHVHVHVELLLLVLTGDTTGMAWKPLCMVHVHRQGLYPHIHCCAPGTETVVGCHAG